MDAAFGKVRNAFSLRPDFELIRRVDLNILEAVVAALFYQFAQYVVIRLAHRGFTLGETGLVCFGGTSLLMELLNVTIARVRIPDLSFTMP